MGAWLWVFGDNRPFNDNADVNKNRSQHLAGPLSRPSKREAANGFRIGSK